MTNFEDAGVQPVGVNPANVASHVKYAEKMRFRFPILSDKDRSIASQYGALKDDGRGIQRTVYGIRDDGTIAFAVRGAPRTVEILRAFER